MEYRVRRGRYEDLEQSTLRCRGYSFKPVGRLQLQIHSGGGRADLRIGGRSSDLLIANQLVGEREGLDLN